MPEESNCVRSGRLATAVATRSCSIIVGTDPKTEVLSESDLKRTALEEGEYLTAEEEEEGRGQADVA